MKIIRNFFLLSNHITRMIFYTRDFNDITNKIMRIIFIAATLTDYEIKKVKNKRKKKKGMETTKPSQKTK